MQTQPLLDQAMALPIEERVLLAEALWESIPNDLFGDDAPAVATPICRDAELSSEAVQGKSHEEVMRNARIALLK